MIIFRRAEAADTATVADVFLDSFHATYAFPLAHTDDEVRSWIRERLIPDHETWVAVADDEPRIVAFMALMPGHIEQLYVAQDPARHGYRTAARGAGQGALAWGPESVDVPGQRSRAPVL